MLRLPLHKQRMAFERELALSAMGILFSCLHKPRFIVIRDTCFCPSKAIKSSLFKIYSSKSQANLCLQYMKKLIKVLKWVTQVSC